MAVSATLVANELIRRKRAEGISVLPLAFGQAGVPVHPVLRQALADAADQNGYGPVAGSLGLRDAAAGYWRRRGLDTDPERVLAGPGSKSLLYAVLQAVGGDVVVPRPSWVSYAAQVTLLGGQPLPVPTPPGEGGVPAPDRLIDAVRQARARGRDVRAVVLTLPDNPTGTLASGETVEHVCAAARELDLIVVCDEIYRDLVYSGQFTGPAGLAPERVVVTSGLSKSLALGGWRIGVARLPDGPTGDRLRDQMISTASEIWSCVAQPVQHAAALAFREPEELVEYVARARRLYEVINTAAAGVFAAAGATITGPQAAFYAYPDLAPHAGQLAAAHRVRGGADLATVLLDRYDIAVLPGSAFGEPADSLNLRICTGLLTGDDDDQRLDALNAAEPLAVPWIADALDRLGQGLADLLK